jgi:hypothetical protein
VKVMGDVMTLYCGRRSINLSEGSQALPACNDKDSMKVKFLHSHLINGVQGNNNCSLYES